MDAERVRQGRENSRQRAAGPANSGRSRQARAMYGPQRANRCHRKGIEEKEHLLLILLYSHKEITSILMLLSFFGEICPQNLNKSVEVYISYYQEIILGMFRL